MDSIEACQSADRLGWRSLLLACAVVLSLVLPQTAWPQAAKRVALVVGNAAYADAPLANPVNDAQDVSAKLRTLGFEVTLLTDRTRGDLTTAIIDFGRRAAGAEAALFYFAGHGVQVKGVNYLLPVGRRFSDEADVEADAVEVKFILGRMEEAGAKVSLLILDACRSNPLRRTGRAVLRGLARMDAPSGALIAFATEAGKEAKDGSGRNGTYTKHLLQHIGTPGLPVEEMFKRVRTGVETDTGRDQSPREETSLTTSFYFAGAATAASSPAPAEPRTGRVSERLSSIRAALTSRVDGKPDVDARLQALTELIVISGEQPPEAYFQQAIGMLISYVKDNIAERRAPGPRVEVDPRPPNVFRPADIILAIEGLQTIRRASSQPLEVSLAAIDFSRINLSGLDLEKFDLSHADFSQAFLSDCRCRGAYFAHAKFRGAAIWGTRGPPADFRDARFEGADLAGSKWANVDFTGSNIEKANGHREVGFFANTRGLTTAQRALFPM